MADPKGFITSEITDYILNKRDTLIKSAVIGRTPNYTLDRVSKRFGIKTSERLNFMDLTPALQDGRGCGFAAKGGANFSERDLETAIYKVNDEYCPDDLLNKYAENQVAIAAGKERLPFEEEIANEIVDGVADQVEKLVWQGATSANSGTDLIDGYLTRAEAVDSASTHVVSSVTSADTVYQAVLKVYMAMSEELIETPDAFIALSPALFRQYIQDLVAANLYHYDPANGAINEMFIPGADVKVVKVKGLAGSKKIYASAWRNLVAGMDMMNDAEELKLWFSDDDDVYRLKLRFNIGVTTYFPEEVYIANLGE